ncbi:MAG: PTS sugar transporter subunit IIA [Chlorobium sp.]|nr:MAG: PTS sugar transporter subunit IIA [Chlorobium sp.]
MMNSIFDALEHGRLIELPGTDKDDALEFLGTMLEAIPEVPSGINIVEIVLEHEKTSNTSLGVGWACPHARVNFDGDLCCAIGWSPDGIDYGIPGEPLVNMIVMFFVPDNQRNTYLKEVSSLARVLKNHPQYQKLEDAEDLNGIRNRFLDMMHHALQGDEKIYRARMIRLDSQAKTAEKKRIQLEGMQIEALSVITGPGILPVTLTQNAELASLIESDSNWISVIATGNNYQLRKWYIIRRNETLYAGDRVVYDCIAIKEDAKS